MCADYDKSRFTQILIKRETKDRLDVVKEIMMADYSRIKNKTKAVSYNDTIIALLDSNVSVASGGQSFLLAK